VRKLNLAIFVTKVDAMRNVILHYHLFKNAGTSIDAILKDNFPNQWLTTEFVGIYNHLQVGKWISSNPGFCAFSSHSAQFPLPQLENTKIFPIVFLRHPLDRIYSSYVFGKKQSAAVYHAQLAKKVSFAEYVRILLDDPRRRVCRNMQTAHFARLIPEEADSELDRALEAVKRLQFVGVVEKFDVSVAKMATLLRLEFPNFRASLVKANVSTDPDTPLQQKLDRLRDVIGNELYGELLAANSNDIHLHRAAQVNL